MPLCDTAGHKQDSTLTAGSPQGRFFQRPGGQSLKGFLRAADEATSEDGDPEQAPMAFICKRLKLNLKKLSADELTEAVIEELV